MSSESKSAVYEASRLRAYLGGIDLSYRETADFIARRCADHWPALAQSFIVAAQNALGSPNAASLAVAFEKSIADFVADVTSEACFKSVEDLGALVADVGVENAIYAISSGPVWDQIRTLVSQDTSAEDELRSKALSLLPHLAHLHTALVVEATSRSSEASARAQQRETADLFEIDISSTAQIVAEETAILAAEMQVASGFSDRVSEKANQVLAGSRSSAQSMRDACDTTNSLLNAVQSAREEIASATLSASRAARDARESAKTIAELEEGSKSIGSVLQMIGRIAEQTNILALNATIEAARAGDAGLGFAVVAREVKELSDQTAAATKEVSNSVRGIRELARESVTSHTAICAKVDEVQQIASEISDALGEQECSVSAIAATVNEATEAADETTCAMAEIHDDTSSVVVRLQSLERGFVQVDKSMAALTRNAEEFLKEFNS
ncbi:MAG: methyl-accepting chemotaxis protein [Pseudomonadota bacterium]